MGLLDDAIREHLDLKRRRGADPAEIQRAEQEALGPVRRHPQDPQELPFDDQAVRSEEGLVYEDDLEHDWEEEPFEAGPRSSDVYENPASDVSASRSALDDQAFGEDEPPSGPAPTEPVLPSVKEGSTQPPPSAGQHNEETAEYDLELGPRRDHESNEDPLEETPDFLQDTPDHDQLWFEQRPPRDFNFDS